MILFFANNNKFLRYNIVCIQKISPNDVGWDVFTLDYIMDGPLKTVIINFFLLRFIKLTHPKKI
jgi:hypothetical protein